MLEAILLNGGLGIQILFSNGEQIKPDGRYRWVQTVLVDPHGIPDNRGNWLGSEPYLDPPAGGYEYDVSDNNIYYWDDADFEGGRTRHKVNHYKNYRDGKFALVDYPQDPRLEDGEAIVFETCAVDTHSKIHPLEQKDNCMEWELTNKGVRVR